MTTSLQKRFCSGLTRAIWPALAAAGLGLAVVLLSGGNPADVLFALAHGAFGSPSNIATTLARTTPLLLTGLSVALAFRAGLFNIGGEGQLLAGALAAAWMGTQEWALSGIIFLPLVLFVSMAAGFLWGLAPGWLKARRGVHEVISTIMMNHIAIQLADYLINGPLRAGAYVARTEALAPEARIPVLWHVAPSGVSWGLVVALALCVAGAWFLFRTAGGYELRAVGLGPEAARTCGIPVHRVTALSMGLAGGLAGLAGGIEVGGVHHTLYAQFSSGHGFDGIAVALLARNHPLGVVPAALLFGALRTADRWLQLSAGVPQDLVLIIQAFAILAVGLQGGLVKLGGRRTAPVVGS
jgi:general nucleoside transport system permease protein